MTTESAPSLQRLTRFNDVTRGASNVCDDRPLCAAPGIEQAGFADIRPAHQRDLQARPQELPGPVRPSRS